MIDYEADVGAAPSDEQLTTIATLARAQLKAERELQKAEQAYKEAKAALYKIQERELPEAMLAIGLESFTLATGETINVKETLYASLSAKNKGAAIKWLMDHNHGEIVKENVTVPFEKGQHEKVQALLKLIEGAGYNEYKVDEAVNTGTVKSLIKELMADGVDVPLDLFGAYFARKAEVRR